MQMLIVFRFAETLRSLNIAAHPFWSFVGTDKPWMLEGWIPWDSNDVAPIRLLVGAKMTDPTVKAPNVIITK